MTADRILDRDEATQDGDRMTVTLVLDGKYWRSTGGSAILSNDDEARHDPATVITRPVPAERDWQQGDVVMDVGGGPFIRNSPYSLYPWTGRGQVGFTDAELVRPLTRLVPATGDVA